MSYDKFFSEKNKDVGFYYDWSKNLIKPNLTVFFIKHFFFRKKKPTENDVLINQILIWMSGRFLSIYKWKSLLEYIKKITNYNFWRDLTTHVCMSTHTQSSVLLSKKGILFSAAIYQRRTIQFIYRIFKKGDTVLILYTIIFHHLISFTLSSLKWTLKFCKFKNDLDV